MSVQAALRSVRKRRIDSGPVRRHTDNGPLRPGFIDGGPIRQSQKSAGDQSLSDMLQKIRRNRGITKPSRGPRIPKLPR